jgi:predicted Ser/Thr protein kinase
MTTATFAYQSLLGTPRRRILAFSEFVDAFLVAPQDHLRTSASLIAEAIKHFGFEIVVRSGEPVLSYKLFKDLFSNGVNAVYGQEFCIKHVVDVICSVDKEAGPKRGIVLYGPPASGKTNIVDLISQALEEYTREHSVKLYSFSFRFGHDCGRTVELQTSFTHHPLLLFPIALQLDDGTTMRPRQELFDHLAARDNGFRPVHIPTYFQSAALDKRSLDILEALQRHPRNRGKTRFEVIEEYVCVQEVEFSNAQAKGIANIDEMRHLGVRTVPLALGEEDLAILNAHMTGINLARYEGAMLASNRGMLHIHDAFCGAAGDGPSESEYKPLLMLLGSGRISLESTQASLDNTVVMTTNLEEIEALEHHLAASKLLDRIVRVPVNYLLDAAAEMDILRRDLATVEDRYDVDPNLIRMAASFSVMTRLCAPNVGTTPASWDDDRRAVYGRITPEQKLMIYASQAEDPINTIRRLPHWHPFRSECLRVGINIFEPDFYSRFIVRHPDAVSLEECGLFTADELRQIDDDFMRRLRREHYPCEGRHGLSIRQLQNIMRGAIANANGSMVSVPILLAELERLVADGPTVHHWLDEDRLSPAVQQAVRARTLGNVELAEGEGDFGDLDGLLLVVRGLYHQVIARELTVATVDRDPARIEQDLRRYLQQLLLAKALSNHAFSHILVPKYIYIDPDSGQRVETPDEAYLESIEQVVCPGADAAAFRQELAARYLEAQDRGELLLEPGKNAVTSRDDNLLALFPTEYTALLSHRRAVDGISPELLRDAFFHRRNDREKYLTAPEPVRDLAETIIGNLRGRFGYSAEMAHETVLYALREGVIDFAGIIT